MANVDGMVQEGIAAIKAGRKMDARHILEQAVELDDQNEQAWLYLSACVDSLQEQQICLENVLALNPNNAKAKKGLDAINQQLAQSSPPPSAFSQPQKPKSAAPFAGNYDPYDFNDPYSDPTAEWGNNFDSPPAAPTNSSVEWGRNSGPAAYGSGKDVAGPSAEDLDNWMASLPITSPNSKPSVPAFDSNFDPSAGPFSLTDSKFDYGTNDSMNTSPANDPFGRSTVPEPTFDEPVPPQNDAFDFGDFDAPSFKNTAFSSTSFDNSSLATSSSNASSADRFSFGGSRSSNNDLTPRGATEIPGSSALFRQADRDAAAQHDIEDDEQKFNAIEDRGERPSQAGIFGGSSTFSVSNSSGLTSPIAGFSKPTSKSYRGIPAEITLKSNSGGGMSMRTLLILIVLNVISLVGLYLNLKSGS